MCLCVAAALTEDFSALRVDMLQDVLQTNGVMIHESDLR